MKKSKIKGIEISRWKVGEAEEFHSFEHNEYGEEGNVESAITKDHETEVNTILRKHKAHSQKYEGR